MAKQQLLVQRAFELFYTQGIHAVGINAVLAASGVAKKTLYHHFASKEALVEATVHYRDDAYLTWLTARMVAVAPGRAALLELFDALDDWFHSRATALATFHGCYFINASAEYSAHDHPVHQACAAHKAKVNALIAEHAACLELSSAQARSLIDGIVLLKEGAISLAHVQGQRNAAQLAKQQLVALLS